MRCLAAYIYAAAGAGESTTEVAWDGQVMIFENGVLLAEAERFPAAGQYIMADIDLDLLRQERVRMGTFDDNRRTHAAATDDFRTVTFRLAPPEQDFGLNRVVERFPFVPANPARLKQDCYEAYTVAPASAASALGGTGIQKSSQISTCRTKPGTSSAANSRLLPKGAVWPARLISPRITSPAAICRRS
jgi:NAD+ synthase (glutamine-hydrolysing)